MSQGDIHKFVFPTRAMAAKRAKGNKTVRVRGGYMIAENISFTSAMQAALVEKHSLVVTDPKEKQRIKNRAKAARRKAAK